MLPCLLRRDSIQRIDSQKPCESDKVREGMIRPIHERQSAGGCSGEESSCQKKGDESRMREGGCYLLMMQGEGERVWR
jgi:hypothetical protein